MKLVKSLYQRYLEAKNACNKEISTTNIVSNLTNIQQLNANNVLFCKTDHFAFLIRSFNIYSKLCSFEKICAGITDFSYASCSIINQSNLSHFKRNSEIIFAYDITPQTIAHIFPADSFSYKINFENDSAVSKLPSQWLPYKEFTKMNNFLQTYNEVICKTNLQSNQFKPSAIICIDKLNKLAIKLSKDFNLKLILIKSCKETINNSGDITSNWKLVNRLANELYNFGIQRYNEEMLDYMNL